MKLHTRNGCPWCIKAKDLLDNYQLSYTEILYETDEQKKWFKENIGSTFPQIFDDSGNHIGGYLALEEWIMENYL